MEDVNTTPELVEQMSPNEILQDYLDSEMQHFINTDLSQRMAETLPKDKNWVQKAQIQRDFALAVSAIKKSAKEAGTLQEWREKLAEDIFGRSKDAVINCCGNNDEARSVVQKSLIGPISALTFHELMVEASGDQIALSSIISDSESDAYDAIDFIYEKDDEILLIQLKSGIENNVLLAEIKGEPRSYFDGAIKQRDVDRMNAKARILRKESGKQVRTMGVMVPAYDSRAIGDDIFGIIKDERIHDVFAQDAERLGFFN